MFQDCVKMLLAILVTLGIVASLLAVSVPLDLDAAVLGNASASAFVFILVASPYLTPHLAE